MKLCARNVLRRGVILGASCALLNCTNDSASLAIGPPAQDDAGATDDDADDNNPRDASLDDDADADDNAGDNTPRDASPDDAGTGDNNPRDASQDDAGTGDASR